MVKKKSWNYSRTTYENSEVVQYDANSEDQPFHYFASNSARWRTSNDLLELFNAMQDMGNRETDASFYSEFTVYKVDLPQGSSYHINDYRPEIEEGVLSRDQIHYLGKWTRQD